VNQDRALVILPTFNERENLRTVVEGIRKYGHDVLVVDDNSPDGTGRLADEMAAADRGVSVLHRPGKLGLGTAYVSGFKLGLERGYGFLVQMDADGSHLPEFLDPLIAAAREDGGLAVGSRYVPGGQIVAGWGPHRRFLSSAANRYCRLVLSLTVHDCTAGFRCYSRKVLEDIHLDDVASHGYAFQVEMTVRCRRAGHRIVEIPIRFEERLAGKSKVSQREIREALFMVLRLRFPGSKLLQRSAEPVPGSEG
jgi:glycosyltransferase involved in cell wall biosynthesis